MGPLSLCACKNFRFSPFSPWRGANLLVARFFHQRASPFPILLSSLGRQPIHDRIRRRNRIIPKARKRIINLPKPLFHPSNKTRDLAQPIRVLGASADARRRQDAVVEEPANVRRVVRSGNVGGNGWGGVRELGRARENLSDEVGRKGCDLGRDPALFFFRVDAKKEKKEILLVKTKTRQEKRG